MGNIAIVNKMLKGSNCPSTKKFDLEDMITKDYVEPMFNRLRGETGAYHDQYEDLKEIFDDLATQVNKDQNENWKNKLIKEMNELATAGLTTAGYSKEEVDGFKKYYNIMSSEYDCSSDYNRRQYYKMFLIYCYIKPFYSDEAKSEDDFMENLASKLEKASEEGGVDSTTSLVHTFGLMYTNMKVFQTQKPDLFEKALLHMHSTMLNVKTSKLRNFDFEFFNATEEVLNIQRDFLVELATNKENSKFIRELSVKLILLIANMRASGEDILVALNLIRDYQIDANIRNELNVIKQKSDDLNAKDDSDFKLVSENSKEVLILTGFTNDPSSYNKSSLTFDENYAYIINEYRGLFKVGAKNTMSTKEGLVYEINSSLSVYKSIAHINGKLYLRDETDAENPLKIIDKNTLQLIEDEGLKKALITQTKSEFNDHVYEVTSADSLNSMIEKGMPGPFRSLTNSPIFSEGENIYVIATYQDKSEFAYYEVEVYEPDTLKFIKSYKLDLEPEKNNESEAEDQNVIDDTEMLKTARLECMTNGKTLCALAQSKLFFFNLETGKRSRTVLRIDGSYAGYDPKTNTFWSFEGGNPTLKSFTIDGFSSSFNLDESPTFEQNYKKALKKAKAQLSSGKEKVKEKSINNLLNSLVMSKDGIAEDQESAKTSENANLDAILFCIEDILNKGSAATDLLIKELDALDQSSTLGRLSLQTELFRGPFST